MVSQVDPVVAGLSRRFEQLKNSRQNWESHWQELADYHLPRKADIVVKRSKGEKRTEKIFDATAIHAAELLASSLHGMLTSPSQPWFGLRFQDGALNESEEAREWLEVCRNVMFDALARSNFQQEIHELYFDLVIFGTGALAIEDYDGEIRFGARHIAEIFIAEDMRGRVDTIFRKFQMTARQMQQRFGEKALPDKVKRKLEKPETQDEEFWVIHAIYPRGDMGKTKDRKPVASIYFEMDEKHKLSESGFDEMPVLVPRFLKDSVSSYGRSPAMVALPDVKMLNKMSETILRAAQKQIDPPLMVPDDGFMLPVRTTPAGLNFYRTGTRDRIEPLNTAANIPLGREMEEQRRYAIRQAFFVDQLVLGDNGNMTATEVLQRNEEKMRLLGPVLGRLQAELLQPMIERVFGILLRREKLPPAPDILQGMDIDIEYVSPLAQAQKSSELQNVMRGIELLGQTASFMPETLMRLDPQRLSAYLAEVTGMPKRVTRSDAEIRRMMRQQQQQEAAMQQQQEALTMSETLKNSAPYIKATQGGNEPI